MKLQVTHTIGRLADDLSDIATSCDAEQIKIVRDGANLGNQLARENARRSQGAHGKHYARSMSAETHRPFHASTASVYSAEYGPVVGRKQGEMSFERGSRNQPPHWDLARSADLVAPGVAGEVQLMLDRMFWAGGRAQ